MGAGLELTPINALSWIQRIAQHTGTDPDRWWAKMERTPPRKIPLGVMLVAPPTLY
jgi:hypothetical protein